MNQVTPGTRLTPLAAVSVALITLSGTGCGNWVKAGVVHTAANPDVYKPSSSTFSLPGAYPNDKGYQCPSPANVTTVGGAEAYVVCPSQTSGFDISVHGTPAFGSGNVCVFPVDVVSSTEAYPNSDATGAALSGCGDITSGTLHFTFTGARFNAAIVVSKADQTNMAWCLLNGNFAACPPYSYERYNGYDTGSPAATTGASGTFQ